MERKLHKIDAAGKTAGRMATQIATLLRGKNKVTYKPHLDEGDSVLVVNVAQMKFTGKKLVQKKYYRVSQYPGGLKTTRLGALMEKNPAQVLFFAVKQMLPATKLRNGMMKRLVIK